MRRVILESPYAGDTEANVGYARACVRDCLKRGEAPIASHLLFTQPGVLDDSIPEERELGIMAGLAWAEPGVAEAAAFYLDRGWSTGMALARDHHLANGISVEERMLSGHVVPQPARDEAVFTLRAWGDDVPTPHALADELERIATMVRDGYQAGEAMTDEDFAGSGWWDRRGFDPPEGDEGYPPSCTNADGHEWPRVEENERSLCIHCGADGDA